MSRDWKTLKVYDRKIFHFSEWAFKGYSGESSERRKESYRESFNPLTVCLSDHEQNVRNMEGKVHSDEASHGNKEHVMGN